MATYNHRHSKQNSGKAKKEKKLKEIIDTQTIWVCWESGLIIPKSMILVQCKWTTDPTVQTATMRASKYVENQEYMYMQCDFVDCEMDEEDEQQDWYWAVSFAKH